MFKVLLALIVSFPLYLLPVDLFAVNSSAVPLINAASITPSSTITATTTATTGAEEWIVPVTRSTPDANGNVIHVVQQGQSLWMIAIAYDTKINTILALNNLSPDTKTLYDGQRLYMPASIVTQVTASPQATNTPVPSVTETLQPTPILSQITSEASLSPTPDLDEQAAIDERFRGGLFIALVVGVVLIVGGLLVSRR